MKRREFITLAGSAAAWPVVGRAQQVKPPVIGFLHTATSEASANFVAAFRQGLMDGDIKEGRDASIEFLWAENQLDRLPAMAENLVRRPVSVIVASPAAAALAAKAATSTIPIVFQFGGDPIKIGLVKAFNRPGGNVTGVSQMAAMLVEKRLEILHDTVPNASVVALLADPQSPTYGEQVRNFQQAALALDLRPLALNGREITPAFEMITQQKIDALVVGASTYFYSFLNQIIMLEARHNIPVIYESREFTAAGGLMSYGVDFSDVYRQVGVYTAKIVRGENPANLPIMQPTKFEFIVNLKRAAGLGLTLPPTLLVRATEVIE